MVVTIAAWARHSSYIFPFLLFVYAATAFAQPSATYKAIAPSPGGAFSLPQGAPDPSMALTTGSPSPIMRFVFDGIGSGTAGSGSLALPDGSGFGQLVPSGSDGDVSGAADAADVTALHGSSGLLRPIVAMPRARGGRATTCYDDYTSGQLQSGGEFWTPQAQSAVPVQMPAAVFTGSRSGSRDPVALGPAGHPVNLPVEGPAGAWCRPPPVPMSQSSPLVTRAFWIVVLFPTGVFVVFWLSRGLRIRAVHEP